MGEGKKYWLCSTEVKQNPGAVECAQRTIPALAPSPEPRALWKGAGLCLVTQRGWELWGIPRTLILGQDRILKGWSEGGTSLQVLWEGCVNSAPEENQENSEEMKKNPKRNSWVIQFSKPSWNWTVCCVPSEAPVSSVQTQAQGKVDMLSCDTITFFPTQLTLIQPLKWL